MTTNEKIDKLSESLEKLSESFTDFSHAAEKRKLQDEIDKLKTSPVKEPWWSTLTKFIGLPAVLIIIFLN
jgi:hypothetical protein